MDNSSLIESLKRLLANATIMYHRSHGFHWNVSGIDFPQWHGKFAEIYEDVYGSLDTIAENILKLGGNAPFTLTDLQNFATLEDEGVSSYDSGSLVSDLRLTNANLINDLNAVFQAAVAANQQGIANFIAERIDSHQKWQWQLTASMED